MYIDVNFLQFSFLKYYLSFQNIFSTWLYVTCEYTIIYKYREKHGLRSQAIENATQLYVTLARRGKNFWYSFPYIRFYVLYHFCIFLYEFSGRKLSTNSVRKLLLIKLCSRFCCRQVEVEKNSLGKYSIHCSYFPMTTWKMLLGNAVDYWTCLSQCF